MRRAFEAARALAGLRLKLAKCVLIPLDGPVTEESKSEFVKWLQDWPPSWAAMSIKDCAEYL
eukprot:4359277-Pyramimonas_sp.AAC.1